MNRVFSFSLFVGFLALLPAARAQFVWTGLGTSGSALNAANWSTSAPTGSGTENAAFGNFTGPQTNVLLLSFALNNLDFTGTSRPALTFSGLDGSATLTLNGNVTMTPGNSVLFASDIALSLSNAVHTVDIAGASTLLSFHGSVGGLGSLTKLGAGQLTIGGVANYSGGTTVRAGALVVDGGSITHSAADLVVGLSSGDSGSLALVNGGDVTNQIGKIGFAGSTGFASVSGAGSTWTNTNYLYVGLAGNGFLSISNGGLVTSPNTSVGNNAGGTGVLTIQNAGSTLTNSSTLYVGSEGFGSLQIQSGGTATNVTGVVANNFGGLGVAAVTGLGSTWTNSGMLLVGGTGDGALTINAGGVVTSADGRVGGNLGSTGSVVVSDSGSAWTNSASLIVGVSGSGSLSLVAGGRVNVAGGAGTLMLGSTVDGAGALTIGAFDQGGIVNAATITTGSGVGSVLFSTNTTAASPYYLTKNGTATGSPVTIAGPTQVIQTSGYTVLSGPSTYTGGTVISGGTIVANTAFGALGNGGTVTVASGSTLSLVDASLNNSALLLTGSRLVGNGSLVNATVSGGTLSPGSATARIGSMSFEDLTLGVGTLELDVQHNGVTFVSDTLDVQNSATLTIGATATNPFTVKVTSLTAAGAPGLLSTSLIAGTTYSLGFLTTNGVSGNFVFGSNFLVDATSFNSNLPVTFGLTRTGNDFALTFTAVPEPSTWALLALGLGASVTVFRRRRGASRREHGTGV